MHPWEDWAETWAHYMLIVDVLDTSTSYGLALLPDDPSEPTLTDRTPVEDASFENLMKRWFPLTYALNSLNRSLGMPDGYPFTLASPVVDKLRFVHRVIAAAGDKTQPREAAKPADPHGRRQQAARRLKAPVMSQRDRSQARRHGDNRAVSAALAIRTRRRQSSTRQAGRTPALVRPQHRTRNASGTHKKTRCRFNRQRVFSIGAKPG